MCTVSIGNWEPGHETAGGWPLERLLLMNDRFADRLERAFSSGSERRLPGNEASHHRWHLEGNGGMTCARCGTAFIPFFCTQKYCSQRCNQFAYLPRRRGHP